MGRSIPSSSNSARRGAVAGVLALALAGCSAISAPITAASPDRAPEFGQVVARFVSGQDIEVIEVRSLDNVAVRSAELVLPEGKPLPAYSIDTVPNPTVQGMAGMPNLDIAGYAGRANSSLPGTPQSSTTFVGQIASVALIRLDEPRAYRQVWQNSTIQVGLGDGPGARMVTLPAPKPL